MASEWQPTRGRKRQKSSVYRPCSQNQDSVEIVPIIIDALAMYNVMNVVQTSEQRCVRTRGFSVSEKIKFITQKVLKLKFT